MTVKIRGAEPGDVPAMTDIYNLAGVGTTASYDLEPVTVAQRMAAFEQSRRNNFPVLVAEVDGVIAGFASYGSFRAKAGYRFTVEHSVYVAERFRASGVGRMLMTSLIDYARGHGVHVMIGVLDADNAASIAFHQRLGFVEVGRFPQVGHKFGRWLDAVFVQLTFPES